MRVSEIFYSIQGEAQAAGLPCAFVRLAGCPFTCAYCDTAYAREEPGEELSVEEILRRLGTFPCDLVEVTGGEPLAQPDTPRLLRALANTRRRVLLETSGHLSLENVPASTAIVMDIKTPGSGRPGFHAANLERLGVRDAVKFVICGRPDFEWAERCVKEYHLLARTAVYFSPAWKRVEPPLLAEWILASGLGVRLQLPLHRSLWPGQRGR